jgi:hypothetical protein
MLIKTPYEGSGIEGDAVGVVALCVFVCVCVCGARVSAVDR